MGKSIKNNFKTYQFQTYNVLGEVMNIYQVEELDITRARKYAKLVIANSRYNEVRNSRIKRVY
jgi:hypothetical protein